MSKKSFLAAAVVAAVAGFSAAPALAGEVTGSGKKENQNQGTGEQARAPASARRESRHLLQPEQDPTAPAAEPEEVSTQPPAPATAPVRYGG